MTYRTYTYDLEMNAFSPYYQSEDELQALSEFIIERVNNERYSVVRQDENRWWIKHIRQVENGTWRSETGWIAEVHRDENAPHIFNGFELVPPDRKLSSKAFGMSTSLATTAEQIAGFAL